MASSSRPNDSSSFINPTNYYIQTPAEYIFFFTYPMAVFRYRNMASSPQTGTAHQDLMTAAASLLLPLTTTYKLLAKTLFSFTCRMAVFRYRNMVSRSQTGTANSDLTAAAVAVSLLLPLTVVHTNKFSCRKQNFFLHIHTLW